MNPTESPTIPNMGAPTDSKIVTPESAAKILLQASSNSPLSPIPLPLPQADPNNMSSSVQGVSSNGFQVADDKDIIEPEWVNRAKQIVASNREDPFAQSEALTEFKADYMQKRYNKVIKLK